MFNRGRFVTGDALRKPLTPRQRLASLLTWLNGDLSPADVRRQLKDFLDSFDGSVEAGHLRVHGATPGESYDEIHAITSDALDALRERLVDLLRRGFTPDIADPRWGEVFPDVQSSPSLRVGVLRLSPLSPGKLSHASKSERRGYMAPGAYTLLVGGKLCDLVPFLVAHLLTAPGMAAVARCPAPAPRRPGRPSADSHWDKRCGHFVIRTTGRGRPTEFCSAACRIRMHAERQEEEELRQKRGRTR